MKALANGTGLQPPIIRKLIRKGEAYICGICRSEYTTSIEANGCLNHCWFDVIGFYPVVLRRARGSRIKFRCHFCCRDYDEERGALVCARSCLDERQRLHMHEQIVNDIPLEAPPKRPSRIRLAIAKAAPRKSAGAPATDPVQASAEVPTPPLSLDGVAASEPTAVPTEEVILPAREGRRKESFAKNWVRHDAKYKCSCCGTLYFTKMEVENCFNGHFDEEGFEKSQGA